MNVEESISKHRDKYIDTFIKLVSQPSISSQNVGIVECANLLKEIMESCCIDTKIMDTDGNPVVYGEVLRPDNDFTILFYGHYDVQPPDPIEEWVSPPFDPMIRENKLYGRGTGDNKGQLLAHVFAVKTILEVYGSLPVNVKFIFEGEEEVTSVNLKSFIEKNRELLAADMTYRSDGPMANDGSPIISLGNRGMLYLKLTATGAMHDNHSGNKGGVTPNPAWDLIHLLSRMFSTDGKVLIPDFYNGIRKPTEMELENLRTIPFDPEKTAQVIGIDKLNMDGQSYYKKISLEPTFNINGLYSGYTGKGQKTIIPSTATVKIDTRLVADQDPEYLYIKIKEHIEQHAPFIKIEKLGSVKPSRTSSELEVVQKVVEAVKNVHKKDPMVLPAGGATGPAWLFTDILEQPAMCVPYANADEDNHAPNENMGINEYIRGIETSCNVILNLGKKIEGKEDIYEYNKI